MYTSKSGKYCRYNSYAGGCKKINCPFKHINVGGASKLIKESEQEDKVILKTVNRFSLKRKIFESKEEVRVSINHKSTTPITNNPPKKKMKVEEVSIKTTENGKNVKKINISEKTTEKKEEEKENVSSNPKVKSFKLVFDYHEELNYEP